MDFQDELKGLIEFLLGRVIYNHADNFWKTQASYGFLRRILGISLATQMGKVEGIIIGQKIGREFREIYWSSGKEYGARGDYYDTK